MSYQVTLNSRNVLVPIALEDSEGRRLNAHPSRLDMITAMVISISSEGAFSQEMIPLRIAPDSTQAYAGTEWELRSQKAGRDWHVFYLGIPDSRFASAGPGASVPKSLSVQVVGTSPMTGREEYSGGADVSLQAQVASPVIPGFLGLGERFFPTLLPHNFVESYALDVFEAGGRRDLLLMASLQSDPADRVPVSFGKHWEPKNWTGAVVENLSGAPGGYHVVRGGCFFGRNKKVTHWFGGGIGLGDRSFRQAAADKIRSMAAGGNGAWVFWLDAQGAGVPGPDELKGLEVAYPQARFSIRHPMLHRILSRGTVFRGRPERQRPDDGALDRGRSIAMLPAESAIGSLLQVARILIRHQAEIHRARTEPAHALWSEQSAGTAAAAVAEALASAGQSPAEASGEGGKAGKGWEEGLYSLESTIRDLYLSQGEALRVLEASFDETSGYAARDAVANPMRDLLNEYLAEGTEARSPA